MSTRAYNDRALPGVAPAMLAGLYQHRLLTTLQLHALYTPRARLRWTRRVLESLRMRGLVDRAQGPRTLSCWFATEAGAVAVETAGPRAEQRRRVTTQAQAEGLLRRHTILVNEVGIAFTNAANDRGDECGPDSWRHEIAHPISAGSARKPPQLVVADALLTYLQTTADGALALHQRLSSWIAAPSAQPSSSRQRSRATRGCATTPQPRPTRQPSRCGAAITDRGRTCSSSSPTNPRGVCGSAYSAPSRCTNPLPAQTTELPSQFPLWDWTIF